MDSYQIALLISMLFNIFFIAFNNFLIWVKLLPLIRKDERK